MSKEGSSNKIVLTVALITSITSICVAVITYFPLPLGRGLAGETE